MDSLPGEIAVPVSGRSLPDADNPCTWRPEAEEWHHGNNLSQSRRRHLTSLGHDRLGRHRHVRLARPGDATSAVILMYHRFGAAATPSTNIRLDQFESHIETLATEGYTVLPVPDILARLKSGESVPDFIVGITVDDAHVSVYREAWPRLRRAGFRFTLFVATDPVDPGYANMMNWDEIRELSRSGVTIANHAAAHAHLLTLSNAENLANINRASRIEEETGARPTLLA